MGHFQELYTKVVPFLNDATAFFQTIAIIIAALVIIINKVRGFSSTDGQQAAQMDELNKKVLLGCGFIFLVPTVISIISKYFT